MGTVGGAVGVEVAELEEEGGIKVPADAEGDGSELKKECLAFYNPAKRPLL
jgi:hypothetical protein